MQSMTDYYSAIQLRSDRWSALQEITRKLAANRQGRSAAKLHGKTEELLDVLGPLESYWAFPGTAAFDHLRRQCDHKNYDDLAFSVRRIMRALTSGAYRRRSIPLDRDDTDNEELEDEALLSPEARALTKPYFEVLFVDDGSSDMSRQRLREIAIDEHVKLVFLRRNYGQTAAMHAGIQHANGAYIVTMDGDLQNDPASIPSMLEKLDEGFDLVI